MAHTANRAGPPRPSTTTRLLERKRVQRRPLPNRKDQNRGCGPWEAGGLPAAPRAASPGRLPGVSWCRDGQPAGQEGRLMRGASHPPARASAQRQNKGCWPHATGSARPAARSPASRRKPQPHPGTLAPEYFPGQRAQSGVETRAPRPPLPAWPGPSPRPDSHLHRECARLAAWALLSPDRGRPEGTGPRVTGGRVDMLQAQACEMRPPTPVLRPSHLRPLPRASTSHPVRGSSALRPGADGRAWSLSPALASGGTPKGSSRCSVAR